MQVLNGTGVQSPLQPANAKPGRRRRRGSPARRARTSPCTPPRCSRGPAGCSRRVRRSPTCSVSAHGRRRGRLELRRDEHVVVRRPACRRARRPKQSPVQPANTLPGSRHGREGRRRRPSPTTAAADGAAVDQRRLRHHATGAGARALDRDRHLAQHEQRRGRRVRRQREGADAGRARAVAAASRRTATPPPPRASAARWCRTAARCTHSGGQSVPPTASRTTPTPLPPVATDEPVRHLAVRADAIQAVDHDRVQAGAAGELVADAVGTASRPVVAGAAVRAGRARRRRRACRRPRRRRARRCRRRRAGGRRRRRRAACRCRRRRRCGHGRRARRCGRRSPCPRGGRRAACRASPQRRRRAGSEGQREHGRESRARGKRRNAPTLTEALDTPPRSYALRPPGCERNRCVSADRRVNPEVRRDARLAARTGVVHVDRVALPVEAHAGREHRQPAPEAVGPAGHQRAREDEDARPRARSPSGSRCSSPLTYTRSSPVASGGSSTVHPATATRSAMDAILTPASPRAVPIGAPNSEHERVLSFAPDDHHRRRPHAPARRRRGRARGRAPRAGVGRGRAGLGRRSLPGPRRPDVLLAAAVRRPGAPGRQRRARHPHRRARHRPPVPRDAADARPPRRALRRHRRDRSTRGAPSPSRPRSSATPSGSATPTAAARCARSSRSSARWPSPTAGSPASAASSPPPAPRRGRSRSTASRGVVKVAPLADWTKADVVAFVERHDIPTNPLYGQGYPSIGCWPCTRPVGEGEDERAGRWAGHGKTECGLHVQG